MREHSDDDLPEDLRATADWLRAQAPPPAGHDLDRLRSRVREQTTDGVSGASSAGVVARSRRALTTGVAIVAVAAGLGGAFAIAGKGPPASPGKSASSNGKNAAASQYKPGKGCGDKNHVHVREDECKKPPK